MKNALMALAVMATMSLAASAAPRGDCDLKSVEKGIWCNKCEAELSAADAKGGKCAKDGEKTVTAEFCVKKSFACAKPG